jgi:drug/metabolite transporter (DMT)-like permease
VLLIAAFTLLWVAIEVVGSSAGVPAEEVVFARYGIHLIVMLVVFGPKHGMAMSRTTRVGAQAMRSLLMVAMPLSFLGAVERLPVQTALAIFWIAPLLTMAFDWRTIRPASWGIGLMGFLGAIVILQPPGLTDLSAFGVACAVTMAVSFALYQRMTHMLSAEGTVRNLFHTACWAFVAMAPLALLRWRTPTPVGVLVLAAVGVLGFLAWYVFDLALRRAPTDVIAAALYTQPVFGIGAGWLFGGTPATGPELAGSILVAAALSLTFSYTSRRAAPGPLNVKGVEQATPARPFL